MKSKTVKNILALAVLVFLSAFAQAQTISGTITDASGPLPGANVVEKGTSNGVQADFDGNYTLTVEQGATIIVSFLGYKPQELVVSGNTMNIVLEQDASQLNEIIVTGYGSQQKKEITSAVVKLDEEAFNKGTVNNVSGLLQGKVAGLTISNRGGDPNSTGTIRLRGISTIGANAEPLVVIDGVIGASLANVDPNDIESINVLKDGSAAAIYGSRASSGVILVTTKKGAKDADKVNVDYSGSVAVSSIANTVNIMDAAQFVAAGGNDLGAKTDWLGEVTRSAVTHIHNASISGGHGKTSYRVSANLREAQGILKKSGFDQFNTRGNFNTKILNDKLNINFNFSHTKRNSEYGFNEALRYAVLYNPTAPISALDNRFTRAGAAQYGNYFEQIGLFDSFNPASIINQNYRRGVQNTLNYSVNLKYDILENLSATAIISDQTITNNKKEYYPVTSNFRGNATSLTRRGLAKFDNSMQRNKVYEGFVTYNHSLEEIKLKGSVTGGYSYQQHNFSDHKFDLGDFPDTSIDYSNQIEASQDLLNSGQINAESSATPDEKIIAFFGRMNASYDDAIFFNASIRSEGSTKLGKDNQQGLFPAVGLGADLNKYLDLSGVELLKLRVGYGVTGALPRDSGLSEEIRTFNSEKTATVLNRAANPDLKWEEKAETNIGLEFNTSRLSATVDFYTRDIKDFIIERTVDAAKFGVDKRFENAGEINTTGLEIMVNYDVVKNTDWSYNTGIVFSTYKSKLTDYVVDAETRANLGAPGQNETNVILVKKGEEIGQIWGPVFTGEVKDGSQVLKDINGDGVLKTAQGDATAEDADFAVLGKGIPDFELGWTNRISYKNWDLNAFFRGAFGHSLVNTYRVFYEPRVGSQASYNFVNTKYADPNIKNAQFSSLYVEKADFFRLDNLTIGYNINNIESKYIKSVRLTLSGQNLFTITGYTGNDPTPQLQDLGTSDNGGYPSNQFNPDVLSPGIDRRSNYFSSRTFTFGVNIKL